MVEQMQSSISKVRCMFLLHSRNKTKLTRVVTPSKAMQDKLNDSPCPRRYPKVYKLRTVSKLHYNNCFMCVGRELFLGMHPSQSPRCQSRLPDAFTDLTIDQLPRTNPHLSPALLNHSLSLKLWIRFQDTPPQKSKSHCQTLLPPQPSHEKELPNEFMVELGFWLAI